MKFEVIVHFQTEAETPQAAVRNFELAIGLHGHDEAHLPVVVVKRERNRDNPSPVWHFNLGQ